VISKRLKEIIYDMLPDEIDSLLDNMQLIRNQMKGDFQHKVKQLDKLTSDLIAENKKS
jgi:hypothetical protein